MKQGKEVNAQYAAKGAKSKKYQRQQQQVEEHYDNEGGGYHDPDVDPALQAKNVVARCVCVCVCVYLPLSPSPSY